MSSNNISVFSGPPTVENFPSSDADFAVTNENAPSASFLPSPNNVYPNVLSEYASYSCIITFGMLTTNELNNPDRTYRKNGPERIIARSGGAGSKKVPTAYEKEFGITTEYFIDDLEITSVIAPTSQTRETNAHVFTFNLKEPYSMGVLLQTLAVSAYDAYTERAADENSTVSYIDIPYLIGMQFIGWNDDGTYVEIPNTTRWIPIRLATMDFTVGPEGTVYNISAYAYNEMALIDEFQTINQDIDVKGSTVADFLQLQQEEKLTSLTGAINEIQIAETQAGNKQEADQYVIAFPKDGESLSAQINAAQEENQGATVTENESNNSVTASPGVTLEQIKKIVEDDGNINEIGLSKLAPNPFEVETRPMGRALDEGVVTDTVDGVTFLRKGNIAVREDLTSISFKKGMRIQEIIEDVVLLSEYAKQFVNDPSDDLGQKKFFRIETDVYNLASQDNVRQRQRAAKIFVYKVVPYRVSESFFNHPSSTTKGIDALRNRIPKYYDYIYSGKNDDIINFDLNFNTSFYSGMRFDLAQLRQEIITKRGLDEEAARQVSEGSNNEEVSAPAEGITNTNTGDRGGSGNVYQSAETAIARYFTEELLNSPADLINLDLEIWGDPYYIADSGTGNYTAKKDTELEQTTIDKTIDYQNNEPYLILNFKTPIDYDIENESSTYGQMKFPESGGQTVTQFSGIYRIHTVTNTISGNKFTQNLSLTRLRNQTGSPTGTSDYLIQDTNELFSVFLDGFQASNNGSNIA